MTQQAQEINSLIQSYEGHPDFTTDDISDGYHSFGELYEHRIALYVALCRTLALCEDKENNVWKSKRHCDGSQWDGWFIMGIGRLPGNQITYHLPDYWWNRTFFARALDKAPPFDGHTPEDVLQRLRKL